VLELETVDEPPDMHQMALTPRMAAESSRSNEDVEGRDRSRATCVDRRVP